MGYGFLEANGTYRAENIPSNSPPRGGGGVGASGKFRLWPTPLLHTGRNFQFLFKETALTFLIQKTVS